MREQSSGALRLLRMSPTWKRFLLAQWLYVSVPLADGTAHPRSSPTLYTAGAGADDTDAARRAQEAANTATRRLAIDARAADGTSAARDRVASRPKPNSIGMGR